jgi:hypothetical protein
MDSFFAFGITSCVELFVVSWLEVSCWVMVGVAIADTMFFHCHPVSELCWTPLAYKLMMRWQSSDLFEHRLRDRV